MTIILIVMTIRKNNNNDKDNFVTRPQVLQNL